MNYLLDTCAVSDFLKKNPPTVEHFKNVSPLQMYVSTITVMEIEYGLRLNREREKKILPIWDSLSKNIQIVPFTEQCAKEAASIRALLKQDGRLIGPFDILIAGTAVANDLTVVTSNLKEFKRISGILIENWRVPS